MAGENTGTADFLPKNNEEWLVWKAKDCLKTDPYAAKSWLLTARTLYPRNFTVQYEAYTIEKNSRNIEEVAKILKEMFVNFPQEPMLWQEVKIYSEALQSEAMDAYTMFLKDSEFISAEMSYIYWKGKDNLYVFAAFPSTLQYHLLVNVAETTHDVLQQCRLMLLVLERYPDRVPDQGVKLMESLMATEKHHQPPSPVNCYRKYLVCHVLPQVLRTCPQSSPKHLYRWLQKAIEFYVCYITQPPIQETTPLSPDLQSPTNQRFGAKKVVIPGLNEKESYIENPWAQLFGLLEMIGKHLEWDMAGFFGTTSCGAQWQRLQSLWESTSQQPSSDSSNQVKQVLYCGTILFLHCLYKYASHVDPQQFSGMTILPGHPVVLIEALRADGTGSPEHKSKKLRKEQQSPRLTASSSLPNAADLTDTFLTALQCWELLHSVEALSKDFMKLLQHWKSDSWTWLRAFEIDVLIYQGFFKEAVTKLIHERNPKDNLGIRTELQIACCQYCLGNYSQSCERVLQVVSALPMSSESASHLPAISSGRRHLQLLICKESEILPYCIQLLITCFKEKAFHTAMPDDLSLGHMLVLMQYNWSNYESLFCDIMHKIQRQGNFTYNIFFNYIINIDILEEFAHLKTQDGGKMNLDILPTSTKQITQTRTVTRGVNKGVKEDFRAALEKQVSRCGENVESVIRHFFVEERDLLQQHLM